MRLIPTAFITVILREALAAFLRSFLLPMPRRVESAPAWPRRSLSPCPMPHLSRGCFVSRMRDACSTVLHLLRRTGGLGLRDPDGLQIELAAEAALDGSVAGAGGSDGAVGAEHAIRCLRPARISQGACLALEYAARHAIRYGGLIGLSGGLIGPEGMPRDYSGHFAGTPVFLGCSDVDLHLPVDRVHDTARVLGALGGMVTKRIYEGMGHAINDDEIRQVEKLAGEVLQPR